MSACHPDAEEASMPRALRHPTAKMLSHLELVYARGERALARTLLEALGFRVLDPQTDPLPENLGPAAAPFLIVYVDPRAEDVFDNVLYGSEVSAPQRRFEEALRKRLAADGELAQLHGELRAAYAGEPQAMTHVGVGYASAEEIERACACVAREPALAGRVVISPVYRPGGPGSLDDRVVQAFVYTDVVATGLLCAGQQLELQVRVDAG
jgi:hypothetical protein